MLTDGERAGLRAYLRTLPDGPAFRTPFVPAHPGLVEPGPLQPSQLVADEGQAEHRTPEALADAAWRDPAARHVGDESPPEGTAALAEAITGMKVLLDLTRALPLSRAAAVLVERVGKMSRRLEAQLWKLRSA